MSNKIKNEEKTIKHLVEDLEGYNVSECDILTTKAIEQVMKINNLKVFLLKEIRDKLDTIKGIKVPEIAIDDVSSKELLVKIKVIENK